MASDFCVIEPHPQIPHYPSKEEVTITTATNPFDEMTAMKEFMDVGLPMLLTIVWRPFAGNKFYCYDHNLHRIISYRQAVSAKSMVWTNVEVSIDQNIAGSLLFSGMVDMKQNNHQDFGALMLRWDEQSHTFKDEFSCSTWNSPDFQGKHVDARFV